MHSDGRHECAVRTAMLYPRCTARGLGRVGHTDNGSVSCLPDKHACGMPVAFLCTRIGSSQRRRPPLSQDQVPPQTHAAFATSLAKAKNYLVAATGASAQCRLCLPRAAPPAAAASPHTSPASACTCACLGEESAGNEDRRVEDALLGRPSWRVAYVGTGGARPQAAALPCSTGNSMEG